MRTTMSNVEGGGEFTISGVENVSESFFLLCFTFFRLYNRNLCYTFFNWLINW